MSMSQGDGVMREGSGVGHGGVDDGGGVVAGGLVDNRVETEIIARNH